MSARTEPRSVAELWAAFHESVVKEMADNLRTADVESRAEMSGLTDVEQRELETVLQIAKQFQEHVAAFVPRELRS